MHFKLQYYGSHDHRTSKMNKITNGVIQSKYEIEEQQKFENIKNDIKKTMF